MFRPRPALFCAASLNSALLATLPAVPAAAAPILLNEYNAVGGGADDFVRDGDTFFGAGDDRVAGNGGNWFELIVVEDGLDARGFRLAWTENENNDAGERTAGEIVLSDDAVWGNLRAGTLLTFIETADGGGAGVDTGTDLSFDPAAGDWWINVATRESQGGLVSTVTNDGAVGDFSVGRERWSLTILDRDGAVIIDASGEGSPVWAGDGVSGSEGGSLEGPVAGATLTDWRSVDPASGLYDDTGSTSFGAYNVDFDSGSFMPLQDPSALQALVVPEPAAAAALLAGLGLVAGRRRQR